MFFAFIDYGPIKLKFGMENVKLISYLVSFFFFGLVCSSLACFLVWLACLFVGVRRLSCLFVCIGCLVFNNILIYSKKKKKEKSLQYSITCFKGVYILGVCIVYGVLILVNWCWFCMCKGNGNGDYKA